MEDTATVTMIRPEEEEGEPHFSKEFLEAEAKYPPGHPERMRATFNEFRGRFEPEYWVEVRRVRLQSRFALTMPPDWEPAE